MDLGKVNFKTSGKDSQFLMPLRKFVIHGKKSKYQTYTGIWKKLTSALMDDFKVFKIQWKK